MKLKFTVLIILLYHIQLVYRVHSTLAILHTDSNSNLSKFLIYDAEINCNSDKKFDCHSNNTCIDPKYVCNGFKDCPNGEDETDKICVTANVTCSNDQFQCDKYKCFHKDWLCDGEQDCEDKTDEGEYCKNLNCTSDYFKCKKNGKCIPKSFICDHDLDCGHDDNSDEWNCTYPPCKEVFEFRCLNQKCISIDLVCDGDSDCTDASDEKDCSKTCTNGTACFTTNGQKKPKETKESKENNNKTLYAANICHKDEFHCGSNECINKLFLCDGKMDCLDNSDEKNCTTIKTFKEDIDLDCLTPSKQCVDIITNKSICLPIEKFCNNHRDCIDGSDEGGHCDKDPCFNTQCQGSCHNTPSGALCYCPEGSTLGLDGQSCLKKNSVCEFGTCSQFCVPLVEKFATKTHRHKCVCFGGYMLESDGFTCKSLDTSPAYIIFSNRHEIRSIDLGTMTSSRPLVSGLKNTIALDFFHSKDNDLIFFTDIVDDKIYKGSIIMGSLINIQVIVETGLSTAEGLAVDYIGENLYWIESMLDQIEVAKFDGSCRKTLIAGSMESPRSIALDPRHGIIFWTDWNILQPRIESASMSGEDRMVIYNMTNKEGSWPNGLTVDYELLRIYWVDARSDSIRTITYDGKDHREILRNHDLITHPFAITLFGNYLYYTDWKTNSVIKANKFNGSDIQIVQKAMTQPFDIKIYHPSRQPRTKETHPCSINNGNCTHLCLLSKKYIWRCECPHIMKLDKDNRTCIPNEQILLFSRPNEIRGVDLNNVQYHVIPPLSLPAVINTQQIDFLAKEKRIYWADTESNELKRSNLNGSTVNVIIDTVIENPSGLAIDWIAGNIFVTSQETKPKIYVCNSNGEYIHTVIDRNLSKPYSLAVDPFNGTLFWSDYGSENQEPIIQPYIGFAQMDGSNPEVLVSSKNEPLLSKPSSLVLKFKKNYLEKLYWTNVGSGSIQSYDFETKKIATIWQDTNNIKKLSLAPYALCLKGDKLLFSSQKYSSLYELNEDNKDLKELPLLRNQSEVITALKIYDKDYQYGSNQCEVKNGNCSHLCLPISSDKRKCRCAIGFEIDPNDETKCKSIANEFLLMAWNLGLKGVSLDQTVQNGSLINVKPVLPPISRVLMATNIDFSYSDSYIYWVDSDDGSITRIKHDTTGFQTVIKNVDNLEDIAIDWISKNMYLIESTYGVIEVSKLNGSNRYVIVDNITKPLSLAIDPVEGYLFWSDVNESTSVQVFRSRLDGSGAEMILNDTTQIYVNKLTIDLEAQQIYWCDSKNQIVSIERMNYDGSNRTVVYKNNYYLKYPVSLTVHKQFVYWADTHFNGGSILKIDKDNLTDQARNASIITEKIGDHIKDIQVYYEQPTNKLNPCSKDNGGCAELCIFMGGTQHRCICSHGRLSSNNRTCEPYEAFIMFSRIVDIDSIHVSDDKMQNSPYPLISNKTYMQNVIGLTFSYKNKKIIYSDIQKGSINSMNFNGTDHRILVDKQGAVEGIAYDSLNDEIYFTSNSDASINRFRISNLMINNRTVEKIIKLTNQDKPRGIALDSCRSMVYWTNWNVAKPSIQRSYLNGNIIQSIITTDIRMPNSITLDHKLQKLYWSDARLDKIERCNYDGSGCVVIISETPQHAFDLAIYGDFLYWSDWICPFGDRYGKGCIYRVNKFTGSDLKLLKRKVPRPMGIIAVANDTEDCSLNPCLEHNGQCQDRCNVDNNGTVVCSCFMGKRLSSDMKTCEIFKVENITCAADEFKCKSGKCISQKHVCDTELGDCGPDDNSDEQGELCKAKVCQKDEFKCNKTGICISKSHVCDGDFDCSHNGINDRSDEAPFQNCSLTECKPNEFRCNNGGCILLSYYCDFDDDCGDLSDEPIGCYPKECKKDQFKCKTSNRCVSKSAMCNGISECNDNSDEDAKICNSTKKEHCSNDEFECSNKKCISLSLICNKKDDCGDNSDESKCNINECDTKNPKEVKCAQICQDLPIGYRCSCRKGFVPIGDGKLCEDINECNQTTRFCSQHCTNLYGSYNCSCDSDYISLDNGTSCLINSTIEPLLLFSNRYLIRQTNLKGGDLTQKVSHLTNAVALDYDYEGKCIYWSNITPLGSLIKRTCQGKNDTHDNQLKETIHSSTVQSPDGLAVDWISKNLYWCDKMKDTIEVSKLNGLYRKVIIKDNLQEPRAIVLNPYEGFLVFSDWGSDPYIARASMDGSNRRIIISDGLGWPNALAISYESKEIFYGDAKLDFIAVSDYEGKRRSTIISKRNSRTINHVFAISVFEDSIYFSDWESKSISKCHKYKCENTTKLVDLFHRPMDIQVYHPSRQRPLNQTNPCDKLNCQTLCLLKEDEKSSKLSATCACPENFILNSDQRTCSANCTASQFLCKTTFNCIPMLWVCDGQDDCGDHSDEPKDCPPFYCVPGQMQCGSGGCISPNQICDGNKDCTDGSDEKDCDNHICSQVSQFKCPKHGNLSSFCIKKTRVCDGLTDCPGNEDEIDCPEKHCPKDNFKCRNGKCLPLSFFCDGSDDCGDSSDEPPDTCGNRTTCIQDHIYCKHGYCSENKWRCEQPYSCLDKEFCYNDGICTMDKINICEKLDKSSSRNSTINCHTYSRPKCQCKDTRYQGARCEKCDRLTCENGGACTYPMNFSTPECRCAAGYLGNRCEKSLCDNYCSNGGICRLQFGIPKCLCHSGYIGKTCAQDTCGNYCLNGGVCLREDNKRKCSCSAGFSGKRCENNKCNCLNGGHCNDQHSICLCPDNFMGKHCERFIATSCTKVQCSNGGICKINEYDQQAYCECTKEYKGIFCDIPVTSRLDCKDFQCLNGGQCVISNNELACNCPEGKFSGKKCENTLSASIDKNESEPTSSKKLIFILLAISFLSVCIFIFIFGFTFKAYERNRHFAHRRMNETHGNLEIRNPIFDGDLIDDSLTAGLNPAYNLEAEDEKMMSSNFDNPVYNNLSYNNSPRTDESRNLLIDDQSISRNSNDAKFHPLA